MATLRNLAIGVLKTLGADNIAKTTRTICDEPQRALPILGIAKIRTATELDQALDWPAANVVNNGFVSPETGPGLTAV
ncbi:hypothetical protein ACWCQ0_53760 [Streptomyces massasporeus]